MIPTLIKDEILIVFQSSLFQAPRETCEGESEGTKTTGVGERKRGKEEELVYRHEVFKRMITGSSSSPLFLSPASLVFVPSPSPSRFSLGAWNRLVSKVFSEPPFRRPIGSLRSYYSDGKENVTELRN